MIRPSRSVWSAYRTENSAIARENVLSSPRWAAMAMLSPERACARARVHPPGVDGTLPVRQLAHGEVPVPAVDPLRGLPAQEDVTGRLHEPLPLDDALAFTHPCRTVRQELGKNGRLRLLDLKEQRIVRPTWRLLSPDGRESVPGAAPDVGRAASIVTRCPLGVARPLARPELEPRMTPTAVTAEEGSASLSAVRSTWASPLYRGAILALFLSGLGASAAAPQIALFLVEDLHVSLSIAGLYYLTNITAPIAGYLVGARSDRTGRRLGLFRVCAVAGFAGWSAIAVSTQAWMPFAVSAVVLAFSGAAGSQLFAAIHDDLRATANSAADGVVSVIRMALTAGWIIGPVLGSLLASVSPRLMLAATAVCSLAQIAPLGLLRESALRRRETAATVPHPSAPKDPQVFGTGGRPGVAAMMPLLAFTGLYVLVYAGEPIKYGYLPLYMHNDMHLPTAVSGAVIGIQPLVELILMPVAAVAARRIGLMHLMVYGASFGVGANLCFALTGSPVGMFAGQILMGGVWGVFAALGIIVAQRLLPQAVATASAVFMSSTAIASALGGLTGGLGVEVLGLPHVFLIPAALGLLATAGIAVMSRSRHGIH